MPDERKQFGKLTRETAAIEAATVDTKARTVEVAFSSETPVRRGGFFSDPFDEVLDHSPESIRLDRFNGGAAPLLMHHDGRDIVGVVETASIDSDRRGRAVVRLGKGERASEVLREIEDGIFRNVSVGYRIHEAEITKRKGEADELRAIDWEPVEVSIVGVGADPQAGVGRGLEDDTGPETLLHFRGIEPMTKPTDDNPAPKSEKVVSMQPAAADKVRAEERARIAEIGAIAGGWKHIADVALEAARAVDEGLSVDTFRANIMPILQSQRPEELAPRLPEDRPRTELGMSNREAESYSVVRAIRALLCMRGMDNTNDPRKIAPFELECSGLVADELGVEARGLLVPYDVQQRTGWNPGPSFMQRAAELGLTRTVPMGVATTGTVAAALKGTELLASSFIEALNSASVALRAGTIMIPGLVGDVDIPKQTGQAAWTWLAEDADGTDTEISIGTVALAPKTISGPVPITRKLLKQSTPAVEMIVRNDLVIGAGRTIDLGILKGTGASNQPTGIRVTSGVNTATIADVTGQRDATFAEMVGFETAVGTDNALSDSAVYMLPWANAGVLKTALKDAGSGQFVFQNGEINGYGALATSQLATDEYLFGSFNQSLLGMWGVLDINVDVATKAASGGVVLRPFQDVDVGVRHAEAFCIEN